MGVYGGFAPVWSKKGVYGGFAPVWRKMGVPSGVGKAPVASKILITFLKSLFVKIVKDNSIVLYNARIQSIAVDPGV